MLNIEAINERFVGLSKAILKRRNLFLVLMVLVLAFSVYGLKQLKTDTDDSHYFDEGDALLVAKDYMASIFGNDNFCAVLVETDNVFTPKVLKGIREMGKELLDGVPYADDVELLLERRPDLKAQMDEPFDQVHVVTQHELDVQKAKGKLITKNK